MANPRKVRIKQKTPQRLGVLKEVKRLQNSYNLLIPRLPFQRVVREVLQSVRGNIDYRLQAYAIAALHESAEILLTQLFEDATQLANHRSRVTVAVKDYNLARKLLEKYESSLWRME